MGVNMDAVYYACYHIRTKLIEQVAHFQTLPNSSFLMIWQSVIIYGMLELASYQFFVLKYLLL